MGLRADRPFVLWVHSALSPTPDPPEPVLVTRWIEALRAQRRPAPARAGRAGAAAPRAAEGVGRHQPRRLDNVAFHGRNPIDRDAKRRLLRLAVLQQRGRRPGDERVPRGGHRRPAGADLHAARVPDAPGGDDPLPVPDDGRRRAAAHGAGHRRRTSRSSPTAVALGGARDERNRRFLGGVRPAARPGRAGDAGCSPTRSSGWPATAPGRDPSLARGAWLRPLRCALAGAVAHRRGPVADERRARRRLGRARARTPSAPSRRGVEAKAATGSATRCAARRGGSGAMLALAVGKRVKSTPAQARHRTAVTRASRACTDRPAARRRRRGAGRDWSVVDARHRPDEHHAPAPASWPTRLASRLDVVARVAGAEVVRAAALRRRRRRRGGDRAALRRARCVGGRRSSAPHDRVHGAVARCCRPAGATIRRRSRRCGGGARRGARVRHRTAEAAAHRRVSRPHPQHPSGPVAVLPRRGHQLLAARERRARVLRRDDPLSRRRRGHRADHRARAAARSAPATDRTTSATRRSWRRPRRWPTRLALLARGRLRGVPQAGGGRVYRRADFSAAAVDAAVRELRERHDSDLPARPARRATRRCRSSRWSSTVSRERARPGQLPGGDVPLRARQPRRRRFRDIRALAPDLFASSSTGCRRTTPSSTLAELEAALDGRGTPAGQRRAPHLRRRLRGSLRHRAARCFASAASPARSFCPRTRAARRPGCSACTRRISCWRTSAPRRSRAPCSPSRGCARRTSDGPGVFGADVLGRGRRARGQAPAELRAAVRRGRARARRALRAPPRRRREPSRASLYLDAAMVREMARRGHDVRLPHAHRTACCRGCRRRSSGRSRRRRRVDPCADGPGAPCRSAIRGAAARPTRRDVRHSARRRLLAWRSTPSGGGSAWRRTAATSCRVSTRATCRPIPAASRTRWPHWRPRRTHERRPARRRRLPGVPAGARGGAAHATASPAGDAGASAYWTEELENIDYLIEASPLIVRKLRHHAFHITGIRPVRLPRQGRRAARALRGAACARCASSAATALLRAGVARAGRLRLRDRRAALQRRHAEVLRGAHRHGARRRAAGPAREGAARGLRDRARVGAASPISSRRSFRAPPTCSWTFPSCSCSRRRIWPRSSRRRRLLFAEPGRDAARGLARRRLRLRASHAARR